MTTKTEKIRAMALSSAQVKEQQRVIERLDPDAKALLLHYVTLSNSLLDIVEGK